MPLTLAELFAAPKRLSSPVRWSRNGSDLTFLAPLEINGVTYEGLFLRGGGKVYRPDAAIILQLEARVPGKRSGGQIERVCWNPLSPHTNPFIGPAETQGLEITGSHFHDFHLNVNQNGDEMRRGNLRIAKPITPNPQSFSDLIDFCGDRFSIENLQDIATPPWEADLFGGEG